MKAPASIANAARARVRASAPEIENSLKAIAEHKPFEAEPDSSRRRDVMQDRKKVSLGEARQLAASATGAEKIWGQTIDFVDVIFFERGMRAARAVCRIISRSGQAIGTGFMISPRLLITNNHVIASAAAARSMLAEFEYERDDLGLPREVTRFALAPEQVFLTDGEDNLDFTIVALGARVAGQKSADAFGYLPLSGARNKHALGDFVNIIQHPDGRLKEAVIRENQLVSRPRSGTVLHYVCDTEPGSSGSPVFNVQWKVVALHHWGGPHRELFDEHGREVPRTVNEGIRASAITLQMQTLKSTLSASARSLIDHALQLGVESAVPAITDQQEQNLDGMPRAPISSGTAMTVAADGTATWLMPLAVSVRLGGLPSFAPPASSGTSATPDLAAIAISQEPLAGERRLEVDEDYENRDGYDERFLPSFEVPLPKLSAAQQRIAAKVDRRHAGENPFELKYEHFSVLMNRNRRLAFFTATNIDGSKAKDVNRDTGVISDASGGADEDDEAAEAAETWFSDPRINAKHQTPPDFYSGQTTFDAGGNPITNRRLADHRNRMFQQGHLTRRQDPLWGSDDVVERAHADTFHVTNRSPQVGYFNMGIRKRESEAGSHPGGTLHWRALEDYVLNNARADRQRVTVFTGPILGDDDEDWDRGRPDMAGFKIPAEYWKLVLRVEDGKLRATALIADQSPLIDHLPELLDLDEAEVRRVSFDKVAKYHVSVEELERRTGLKFGRSVVDADTFVARNGESRARAVESLAEISLDGAARKTRRRAPRKRATKKKASRVAK